MPSVPSCTSRPRQCVRRRPWSTPRDQRCAMTRLREFWASSVGKKAVMGVTGLIGVLFVIGHMIGNLQLFQGAERINAYSRLLHGPLNELLWAVRIVLLGSVVLHIVAAYQLTIRDRAARPVN